MKNKKKNLPKVVEPKQIELAQDAGPMAQVTMFIASGGKFEDVEKMMELQDRFDAKEAKKAYHKAMADFKSDPPKITKDKHVDFATSKGRTSYSHASLGNVTDIINSALGKCGLTVAWPLEQSEKGIKVTCTITHELGHSESTFLFAANDTSGTKNSIQAMGSTISYLQRYTVLALTGLATQDQDDDGNSFEVECLTTDQCTEISDKLKATKSNKKIFLDIFKVDSVEKIQAAEYIKAINLLKRKEAEK